MSSFGAIWPKRSSAPRGPKSGEAEDQTAPIEAAARVAAIVSGMFGMSPATRSPGPMPRARKACCSRETRRVELAPGEPGLDLVLAAEDDGVAVVVPAEEILREVEASPRGRSARRACGRRRRGALPPLSPITPAEVPERGPRRRPDPPPTRHGGCRSRGRICPLRASASRAKRVTGRASMRAAASTAAGRRVRSSARLRGGMRKVRGKSQEIPCESGDSFLSGGRLVKRRMAEMAAAKSRGTRRLAVVVAGDRGGDRRRRHRRAVR